MRPADLTPEHFASYPPLARGVATRGLALLRQLPLSFVGLLLREVIVYDWKFPAERRELDAQFTYLTALPPDQRRSLMAGFASLKLSDELERINWVAFPEDFSEQFSAHLWASGQIAVFRSSAIQVVNAVRDAHPPPAPAAGRLGIVILGREVTKNQYPLFRKLRRHGTYFTNVDPQNGVRLLLGRAAARAKEDPVSFAHWYVDGNAPAMASSDGLTALSYLELEPVRSAVVTKLKSLLVARRGTEARRSVLAQLRPHDIGLKSTDEKQAVLDHFKLSVLSQGSGTQFLSTTFVQWTTREVWRRAQPVTLVARFGPRLTERAMNQHLAGLPSVTEYDSVGALIDADMGAYYTWLNMNRLPGADRSSFLIWFEDHTEALVVSPSTARGVQSDVRVDLNQLLSQATG